MPLSLEQLDASLNRVFVLQQIYPEDRAPYAQTIYEACGWMSGYHFEQVTKDLCRELKGNVRLKPGHFIARYRELALANNWEQGEKETCSVCGASGLVVKYLRRKSNDEIHRVMVPCDVCKATTVQKALDPDLEFTDPPAAKKPQDYHVTPHAARWLLDVIDKATWAGIKGEWVNRLCELAAADADPKDMGKAIIVERVLPPIVINEAKRKNEVVRALIEAEAGRAGGAPATTEPQTSPEEQPSPAPPSEGEWEAIHPAVAHVPKEVRKILDGEAEAQDIPF